MKEEDIYAVNGPLDLTFLMKMYGLEGFEELKTPAYVPAPVPQMMTEEDIFYPDSQTGYFASSSLYDL